MSMTISPYVCPARDTAGNLPIAYMMSVMAKAAEGAPVQHQTRRDGLLPHAWERTMYPIWNWATCSYRIDPATRPMSDVQVGDYLVALGSMSGYNLYPNDVVRVVDHKTLGQDVPIGQEYEPKDKRISDLGLSVWAAGYFRYATTDEIGAAIAKAVTPQINKVLANLATNARPFKVGDYVVCFDGPGTNTSGVRVIVETDKAPYHHGLALIVINGDSDTRYACLARRFRLARPDEIRDHIKSLVLNDLREHIERAIDQHI